MVGQSKIEDVSVRFPAYIEELREFFRSRHVPFGSPKDLAPFAELVNEPGSFQDEMGSMVRSILFQENEALGRGDLLELLTTAVGGPASEARGQDVHAAVRRIFSFLNESLRQRSRMTGTELQAVDEPVTAGDVLAAAPQAKTEVRAVGGRSSADGYNGQPTGGPEGSGGGFGEAMVRRPEPSGSGMLFRAVSMSEPEAGEVEDMGREDRPRWLIPAIVAGVIALTTGVFLAKPMFAPHGVPNAGTPGVAQSSPVAGADSCAGPRTQGSTLAGVAERSRWARRLIDQRLYSAALPELQSIAALDPGYPGINLDTSEALLHLKRPEDARDAVDKQISISECMAKLPAPALDAYCSAEFTPEAAATCRPELRRIRETAQVQAAMVHLELGHRFAGEEGAGTAGELADEDAATPAEVPAGKLSSAVAHPRRLAVLPAATEGDNAQPAQHAAVTRPPAASKTARKPQGDESLIKGEGTDLSLGAYSKPQ